MKFLLPFDRQKFRYYAELLSEIHGRVELKRLSFTKNWAKKNKIKFRTKSRLIIEDEKDINNTHISYRWMCNTKKDTT